MTDHTDLRRLAMAATPGPWQIETARSTNDIARWLSTMHPSPIFELIPLLGYEDEHEQNAAYIAAADPQTVIGLLDRIEALETSLRLRGTHSNAATDVLTERRRQIETEGWTPEHDDAHEGGEMAMAAAAYAIGVSTLSGSVKDGKRLLPWRYRLWPWEIQWWKPSDRRRNLVKAAALIIAEIERLDRSTLSGKEGQ